MNNLTTLTAIERRIEYHMQGVYMNILEVGRCLIEAKESGLVAYGEWEAWVRAHTGMSDRSAQRLMQAAREIEPESAMSRLPISKIQAILALPEAEREGMARRAVDEDMSLRVLQGEIEALKRELKKKDAREKDADKILGEVMEERQKYKNQLDNALQVNERISRNRMEATAEVERLKQQLAAAESYKGISPAAQREIDRLKAELKDAEAMAERAAELRQQAQQELMDYRAQAARGDAPRGQDDGLTIDAVGMAVRTFMGVIGYLPHDTGALLALKPGDRQQLRAYAAMIGQWAEGIQSAMAAEPYVIEEAQ